MARVKRLKLEGEVGYYHIISRTVGGEFYLGDMEKEKLLELIKYYSQVYFVKVIGYIIMSNHFHLLVRMEPWEEYTEEEIKRRIKLWGKYDFVSRAQLQEISKKLSDISEYVKSIKQTFARWYNRRNKRRGYFWGDRFKSVLIEEGEGLLNCLAYIELNSIRAGIVEKPERYRWSSFYERYMGMGEWLSFEGTGLKDFKEYAEFVYMIGGIEVEGKKKLREGLKVPKSDGVLLRRIRYFSDGLVIGSKGFIKEAYDKFSDIIMKKRRLPHRIKELGEFFSVRRLIADY